MRNHLLTNRIANLVGVLSVAVGDALNAVDDRNEARGPSETAALITVFNYPNQTISSLASALGLSHSASVRVAGNLIADRLVKGGRGADRRNAALTATEKGRRVAAAILAARRARITRMLAVLTPSECRDFVGLIEKLLGAATGSEQDADRLCRFCDLRNCPQDICPIESKACALRAAAARPTTKVRAKSPSERRKS